MQMASFDEQGMPGVEHATRRHTHLYRFSGFKVSQRYDLLFRNYPSECNELFLRGLETTPRFFGSSPISRTCAHYSAIADDKLVTLTSLVKTWTPLQKVQCVLWLTEFKSFTRKLRRVRAEWNVVTGLFNRLTRTPTK
ncbi:uncharacterized protein TNCV_2035601 [Trichonephila clavipes]|nr:uncharacterized protein TNCV_2035601 [Trichonephila clavipes]